MTCGATLSRSNKLFFEILYKDFAFVFLCELAGSSLFAVMLAEQLCCFLHTSLSKIRQSPAPAMTALTRDYDENRSNRSCHCERNEAIQSRPRPTLVDCFGARSSQ